MDFEGLPGASHQAGITGDVPAGLSIPRMLHLYRVLKDHINIRILQTMRSRIVSYSVSEAKREILAFMCLLLAPFD